MKLTKDIVLAAAEGNLTTMLQGLSRAQWQRYIELLESYLAGQFVGCGWSTYIEWSMTEVGATIDQAFACTLVRYDVKKSTAQKECS